MKPLVTPDRVSFIQQNTDNTATRLSRSPVAWIREEMLRYSVDFYPLDILHLRFLYPSIHVVNYARICHLSLTAGLHRRREGCWRSYSNE